MATSESLFVYGSFCEGMVHFHKISEFIKRNNPARAQGTAYRLDVGYPVYSSKGEQIIEGQLLEIEAPDVLFVLLDEFHGYSRVTPEKSLFYKTEISVRCEDGSLQPAWVYEINPSKLPRTAEVIADGDWRKNLVESPPVVNGLSGRQQSYILRLGASTGREIVPIDLDLYRELMSLDIIVDKGRRLALSRLGKEIYRYLR